MKYSVILVFVVFACVGSYVINTDQNQAFATSLDEIANKNFSLSQSGNQGSNNKEASNLQFYKPSKNSVTDKILKKLKISACPNPNEQDDGGTCICSDGFHRVIAGAPCTPCIDVDPNFIGDADQGCMCNDFYGIVQGVAQGKCTLCETLPNFQWDYESSCICKIGFLLNNGQCKTCENIDQNSRDNGDGGCVCKDTYVLNQQKCTSCSQIDINSQFSPTNSCECRNDYKKDLEGVCVLCRTTLPLSQGDDNGGCICLPGLVLNSASTACVCVNNTFIYNTDTGQCQSCRSNFYPLNNQCTECPRNVKPLPPGCKFSAHLSTLGLLLLVTLVLSFI